MHPGGGGFGGGGVKGCKKNLRYNIFYHYALYTTLEWKYAYAILI